MKTYDLTTLATAKAFARVKRADEDSDGRVELLISGMSKAIRRYTDREFVGLNDPASDGGPVDTETPFEREYEYDGSGYLSLSPWDVREIVSVTLNGDALDLLTSGLTLGSTEYAPRPRQRDTLGVYKSLTLPEDCGIVVVNAKWGIVGVDPDVELACLHAVSDAYRNPEGAPQRILGDGAMIGEDSDQGGSLPRAARALLLPLCR